MSALVKREGDFIRLLLKATHKQKQILLKSIHKLQLNAIVQIVYNVLIGNRNLPDKDKRDLSRHKAAIRRFVSKGLSQKERKRLLFKHFKSILKILNVMKSELI